MMLRWPPAVTDGFCYNCDMTKQLSYYVHGIYQEDRQEQHYPIDSFEADSDEAALKIVAQRTDRLAKSLTVHFRTVAPSAPYTGSKDDALELLGGSPVNSIGNTVM